MAQTVAVDLQHDGHRDVQEEEDAGIDVHGPVVLCVESEVERRAVSRLYYILQAEQSGAKHRKHIGKSVHSVAIFTTPPLSYFRHVRPALIYMKGEILEWLIQPMHIHSPKQFAYLFRYLDSFCHIVCYTFSHSK